MSRKSILRAVMTMALGLAMAVVFLPALGQVDKACAASIDSIELLDNPKPYTLPLEDVAFMDSYLTCHSDDVLRIIYDDANHTTVDYLCTCTDAEDWEFTANGHTITLCPWNWEREDYDFKVGGTYNAEVLVLDPGGVEGLAQYQPLDNYVPVTIVDDEPSVLIEHIAVTLDSGKELQLMETENKLYNENNILFHEGDKCVVDYSNGSKKTFIADEDGIFYDDDYDSVDVYFQWVKAEGLEFDTNGNLSGETGQSYDAYAFTYERTDLHVVGEEVFAEDAAGERDTFPVKIVGYEWDIDYVWATDYSSVVATATRKDNPSITRTETVNTTSEITQSPTDTEMGVTTYTAEFKKNPFETQVKPVTNIPLRDLIVTGGKEGTDYTYTNGVLTFLKNNSYAVRMRTGVETTSDRIVINAKGTTVSGAPRDPDFNSIDLTLDGVSISTTGNGVHALSMLTGQRASCFECNLVLKGKNTFTSDKSPWYSGISYLWNLTITADSGTSNDSLELTDSNDGQFDLSGFTLNSGKFTLNQGELFANKVVTINDGEFVVDSSNVEGTVYCNDAFIMNGGTVKITNSGSRCIQVAGVGALADAENGVVINGGDLTLTSNGTSGAATITTGDNTQNRPKNIIIDTDGTVIINTEYYGISTFNGGNVTMKNGTLQINGGKIGIALSPQSGKLFIEGGETEIQSASAIHLNNGDKKVNLAEDYVHKNYSGETKEKRSVIDDSEILPMEISGVKVAEPYLLITPAYPITYDLNGGTLAKGAENPDAYSRVDAFALKNPSKEGYDFTGWTGIGLNKPTVTVNIPIKGVTGALSFEANYKLKEYLIQFKTGEGASKVPDQKVKHGSKIDASLVDPVKDGYTLEGWYEDEGLTRAFDLNTTITEAKTLYAKWTENKATFKYVASTGGSVSPKSETVNVITGKAAGSKATPSSGYEFIGWTDENGKEVCSTPAFVPAKAAGKYVSATYIANFQKPDVPPVSMCTVTFRTNGGTDVASQTVERGNRLDTTKLNTTKDGFSLEGWYKDAALTKAFDLGSNVTGSMTLYAKWTENKATITYVAETGGSVSPKSETVNAVTGKAAGSTAKADSDYEFVCWTDSQGVTVSQKAAFVPAKKDGKYISETYFASFKKKGGGQAVDEVALVLPPSDMTYTGQPQTAYSDSKGYTVKNGTATDAGTYKAVLTLKDGFVWADGTTGPKEVSYTIAKATLTAKYVGETIEWYKKPAMKVTVSGFINGETAKTAKGYKAPKAKAPNYKPHKTYSVKPSGGSAANYKFKYVSGKLNVKCKTVIIAKAKAGKSKATISWTKVPGATGYKIYGSKCNKMGSEPQAFKQLKKVKGQKTLKATIKKLGKSSYKFYVVAYRVQGGKTIELSKSPEAHVIINNAIKGHTNPTGIDVDKTSVTVKAGKTVTIKGTIVCKKKPLSRDHGAYVRYKSSDSHIAKADGQGRITGKKKGTCKIYVYTQNGIWKTVKVTVK